MGPEGGLQRGIPERSYPAAWPNAMVARKPKSRANMVAVKRREKNRRSTLRDKAKILARIRRDGDGGAVDTRGRVILVVRIFLGIFFHGVRSSGALCRG